MRRKYVSTNRPTATKLLSLQPQTHAARRARERERAMIHHFRRFTTFLLILDAAVQGARKYNSFDPIGMSSIPLR
jgi:hypothetical protein